MKKIVEIVAKYLYNIFWNYIFLPKYIYKYIFNKLPNNIYVRYFYLASNKIVKYLLHSKQQICYHLVCKFIQIEIVSSFIYISLNILYLNLYRVLQHPSLFNSIFIHWNLLVYVYIQMWKSSQVDYTFSVIIWRRIIIGSADGYSNIYIVMQHNNTAWDNNYALVW